MKNLLRTNAWRTLTDGWLVPARLMAVACVWLTGCASTHYPINAPLPAPSARSAPSYDVQYLNNSDNSWSLLMHLSLSGGGTRAAAMPYGVLEALAATPISWEKAERTLFDEIDG